MQSLVMGCCCASAPACCYSSLMCVVNNGNILTNETAQDSYQATGNSTPATGFNGTPNQCGTTGCILTLGSIGTTITIVPSTNITATWQLYSLRWNNAYDLCTILPAGSGVHSGEMNRDPSWYLKLVINRSGAGSDPAFTLDVLYRRLSQTPPQFQCPSLGVYDYFAQSTTGTYGATMSTSSSVTLL